MSTDELAQRYGRPMSRRRRWLLALAAGCLLAVPVGYATWFALTTGSPAVTWQDIGYRNTPAGVDVTFEVTFLAKAGRRNAAVCTVQALNQVRTVVGSTDVRSGPVGASKLRTFRITASVRTSEPANTGVVTACKLARS